MSSIFACDLRLNGKTLPRNFFYCFVFHFREIFLNQHWRQMRASLILVFGKTKAFFGKDTARKKTAFCILRYFWKMKEKPANLNRWGMFFSEVEGHMQKLSSFGQGRKFGPKSHLCGCCTKPFNCSLTVSDPHRTPVRNIFVSMYNRNYIYDKGGKSQPFPRGI